MFQHLKYLNLKNFRGIGIEGVTLEKIRKINLFVGENNTGKSTILSFLYKYLKTNFDESIDDLDFHLMNSNENIEFITRYDLNGTLDTNLKLRGNIFSPNQSSTVTYDIKNTILNPDGLMYITTSVNQNKTITRKIKYPENSLNYKPLNLLNEDILIALAHSCSLSFNRNRNEFIKSFENFICNKCFSILPAVKLIPTVRVIDKSEQTFDDYSGKGIIEHLANLDRPNIKNTNDQLKFKKIEKFLRTVISNQTAYIEIPNDKSAIVVKINEKRLPLENLGTGISEVIMIATFCTLSENEIICIEEPETHLHPILQKKLIRYLSEETSNQYFIATHSASFIDTPNAAVFHVWLENNETRIKEAILNSDKYNICHQLGYKASDILQANCVVWVEGPSELIYLRYWIECVDSSLVEGIHYSVMFYGGRLLSHLSGDGEEQDDSEKEDVQKFIQLPSLNRNSLIIMDSDKTKEDDEINETKKRIKKEFEKNTGYVWITQGREIENYLKYNDIQDALKANHPKIYEGPDKDGQYDHAFYFKRTPKSGENEGSIEEKADKVSIAKWIIKNDKRSFAQLDLNDRVYAVVNFIRKANGLEKIEMKPPTCD